MYTFERFINCGRMVSVIVHEEDAVDFAQNFTAPLCPLKRSEIVPDYGEIGSGNLLSFLLDKPDYQRDSGGGIEDAVLSRNTDTEFSAEAAQRKDRLPVLDAEGFNRRAPFCRKALRQDRDGKKMSILPPPALPHHRSNRSVR